MFSLSTISSTFGYVITGITSTFTKSVPNTSVPISYKEVVNSNLEACVNDPWIVLFSTDDNEVFEFVTTFDENGTPTSVTTFDENDGPTSVTSFDENGEPTTVTSFDEDGEPTTVTTFVENGTPMTVM